MADSDRISTSSWLGLKSRSAARIAVLSAVLFLALLIVPSAAYAVDVVTDGDMEAAGITNWAETITTAPVSSAKATDQFQSTSQSLKQSTAHIAKKTPYEMFNEQTIGAVGATDTVTLSLWWGWEFTLNVGGAALTMNVDIKPTSGTWATNGVNVWTQVVTTAMSFTSAAVATFDISSSFSTSESYDIRVHVVGINGNNTAAQVYTWWDDVVVDVVAAGSPSVDIADGTDPTPGAPCKSDSGIYLDQFLVSETAGVATNITNITIDFTDYTDISSVIINSNDDLTTYENSAPASNSHNFALDTVIPVSASASNVPFKVYVTVDAAASGGIDAAVSALTLSSGSSGTIVDNSSTITVDETAPGLSTLFAATSGQSAQVPLSWTNPSDSDLGQVEVRRNTGSYPATHLLGTSVYVNASAVASGSETPTDTTGPPVNGTLYYYTVFAADSCSTPNWNDSHGGGSGNEGTGTPSAASNDTALSDATDSNWTASIDAPGSAVVTSEFGIVTDAGSDNITTLQVTTTGDDGEIDYIQIYDSSGSSVQSFGNCTGPSPWTCTGGTPINATTTPTVYTIKVTWKNHATMTTGTYSVTTRVSSITPATNTNTGGDTAGNSFSADNTAPAAPGGTFTGSPGGGQVALGTWSVPGDAVEIMILNSPSAAVTGAPVDGTIYTPGNVLSGDTVIYNGISTTYTDTPLTNDTIVHYKIFSRDAYKNWTAGGTTSATPTAAPVIDNLTTTGSTAVAASATEGDVDVQMEYVQLDCDGAGDNSIEITSVTVDDLQIATTTGIVDNLKVYMGPDTVWGNRYSGNGIQGTWNGDSQPIDITSIFVDDRTITCTTPKYAWIVYDLNATSAPNAIQARVTDVGVAGIDVGLTGQTLDSNNFTIGAATGKDTLAVANAFTNATTANPSDTNVLMQRLELECTTSGAPGDSQCIIDTVTIDDTVVSATGTVDTVTAALSPNADCSSPSSTGNTASWDGQSTPISLGGAANSRDVNVGVNGFLCIYYDFNAAANGNVQSSVTAITVNSDGASDVSPTGAPWNSNSFPVGLSQQFNIIDCNDCHGVQDGTYAPVDSATRNSPEGAVTGKHATGSSHVPTGTDTSECELCHGSGVGSYVTTHQTGVINMSSDIRGGYYDKDDDSLKDTAGFPSDIAFNMSNTPTTAKCRNVYCHGDVGSETPQWGAGSLPCNSCHEATQALSAKHSFHYNSTTVATSRNATNLSDTGNYRFNCGVCHDVDPVGEHVDNSNLGAIVGNGFTVDIRFNLSDWSPPAASPAFANGGAATAVGNFTYWTDGTCSQIYCHSNGQTVPTYQTPQWSDGALGCGGCHGAPNVSKAATTLVGWHGSHMGDDVYNFGCGECHAATVADDTDGPITGFDYHVNGIENIVFATVGPKDQSSGVRDGGINDWCTTLYCHSDGKDVFTPVANTPKWFGSDNTSCTSCHDDNVSTALSPSHAKHVQADPDQSYTCDNCHSETVANNSTATLAGTAYGVHVDGIQNLVFSGTGFSTDHYNFVTDGAGYNGAQCTNVYCHSTVQADGGVGAPTFKTPTWGTSVQCGDCHNADGVQGLATLMASGSHTKHVSAGGESLDCIECHTGGGPANIGNHVDGKITLIINSLHGLSATYSQSDGGGESDPRNNYGTCSSVYCHSSGSDAAGGSPPIYNTPTWGNPASAACGECHRGRKSDAKTMDTQAHNEHLAYGGLDIRCNDCHDGLGSGQAKHVDKNVDFSFLAANAGGSAAYSNSGLAAGDGLYGKCSSVYCHGNFSGGSNAGVGATPNWDDATAACGTCHDNPQTSRAHTTHLGLASVTLTCFDCHAHNGSATHVDMIVGGTLNTAGWYFSASSTYDSQGVSWNRGKADSGNVSTCGTVQCHSTVQGAGGSGAPTYATPNWDNGTPVVCGSCHKADGSQGDNSLMDSGTHTKHVLGESFGCDECHAYGGQYLIANHVNNGIDVGNSTNIGSYDQDGNAPGNSYGTCNTIACHGGNSKDWGGTALGCIDCHGGASDVDDYVYNNGTVAKIDTTSDWDTTGHGRLTGDGPLACTTCHDSGSAHGSATNPFRLKTSSDADINAIDGFNDICFACHATGEDTVDGMTSTLKVDKYHFGSLHVNSDDAGRFCWDCHDPHGDDNVKMIHDLVPLDSTATYGVPIGALVGNPIDFDGTAGSGTSGSGAWARTAAPYDEGLCNVCHRNGTDNYTFNSYDGSHSTGACTGCHDHSKDTTVDGDAWKGAGECISCHNGIPGTVYVDRDVVGSDFAQTSRHVFGGSEVTNWDCIVCHGEGDESAAQGASGSVSTTAVHQNAQVEMRNVDSVTNDFVWVKASKGTPNYGAMDTFCLGCHDLDGASGINVRSDSAGVNLDNTRALTPFNPTDGLGSTSSAAGSAADTSGWVAERTRVLDVKSKISDNSYDSWHQIVGNAVAYSSNNAGWVAGAWVSYTLKSGAGDLVSNGNREASMLHCADCHTVDINAHGGANPFMLAGSSIDNTCFQCHNQATTYSATATAETNSRFRHRSDDGSANTLAGGKLSRIDGSQCRNCHGGNPVTDGWGGIHGLKGADPRSGQPRYRFTGGAYMSYEPLPNDWTSSGSDGNCYFAGSKTQTFSTCGQHNSTQAGRTSGPVYNRGLPTTY